MIRNNITRLLDQQKISYQTFELPAEKLGAQETARILGVAPELVYKTIVVTRKGRCKPILAILPGPSEVDLKALARAVKEKKVVLPTQKEAERLTGLHAGGISSLALLNRGFQVLLNGSVNQLAEIYISGGQRGLNILLPVNAFIKLTDAKIVSISRISNT